MANLNYTPLKVAATEGNYQALVSLIEDGADDFFLRAWPQKKALKNEAAPHFINVNEPFDFYPVLALAAARGTPKPRRSTSEKRCRRFFLRPCLKKKR